MIIAVILLIVMLIIAGCLTINNKGNAGDFILLAIPTVVMWLMILSLSTVFFSEKISKYDYYKISDNQYLRVETYHYNDYVFNDKNLKIEGQQHQEISKINHFDYIVRDIH